MRSLIGVSSKGLAVQRRPIDPGAGGPSLSTRAACRCYRACDLGRQPPSFGI